MITTNLADGEWQVVEHIEDPLDPWSEPVRLTEIRGIDPHIAWDDDGTWLRYVSTEVAGAITGRLVGVWRSSRDLLVGYLSCIGAGDAGLLP